MLLFVYGSLRQGLQNHHILHSARYICECKTIDTYIMIATKSKSFPYILHDKHMPEKYTPTHITGELYEISDETLQKLDILEDHPYTYTRQLINISTGTDIIQAHAYILENLSIIHTIKNNMGKRFVFVLSGDWKLFYNTL